MLLFRMATSRLSSPISACRKYWVCPDLPQHSRKETVDILPPSCCPFMKFLWGKSLCLLVQPISSVSVYYCSRSVQGIDLTKLGMSYKLLRYTFSFSMDMTMFRNDAYHIIIFDVVLVITFLWSEGFTAGKGRFASDTMTCLTLTGKR